MPDKQAADESLAALSRKIVGVICAIVLVHIALVSAGWVMGDPWLIHFPLLRRNGTPMPLSALGLLMCTLSLWLLGSEDRVTRSRRGVALLLAGGSVLLGALVISEYAGAEIAWLDYLLFPRTVNRLVEALPGRPAVATAICTILVGVALLCLDTRRRIGQQVLEFALLLVILVSLERCVGYLYREIGAFTPRWRVFGRPPFQPMSPITAFSYLLLAFGVLYARLYRREGWVGLFYTPGPHQLMARWMVPVAVVAPITFGWLGMLAFRAGLRGTIYPMSLVVSGMIVLILLVILMGARAMRRADAQRVAVEEALAEREKLQSAVLQNAGAGIVVLDVGGYVITANQTAQQMFGSDEAALRARSFWSFVERSEVERSHRLFDELVTGKRRQYFVEVRCRRDDGATFWAEINTSSVSGANGRAEMVIAMLQDVTARREAEETQLRLIDIIEATPDLVGIANLDGSIVYVNRAGRRLTGLSDDELTDLKIDDLHPPEAARRVREEMIPAAIRNGVWSGETELKTRTGDIIPVSEVVLAHRRQNGHVVFLSTVMRDITHRRRLELAQEFLLEVSRASARSMDTDTILRSLVNLVVPRHADYCVMYLLGSNGNPTKASLARVSIADGKVTQLLRVYGNGKQAAPIITEVARTGEPVVVPYVTESDLSRLLRGGRHRKLIRKLGVRSIMAFPLRGRERILGVMVYMRTGTDKPFEGHRVALAREMTERVALALDNADLLKRAREATHIRDEVLRVVAHDLRNPLNTVSLTADFLTEKLHGLPPQPWMSKLDLIIRAVAQANRLIEDLLDVARMETGRLSLETVPTLVRQLVTEVIQSHQPLAEARGIRLRTDLVAQDAVVIADPARVVQVFSNLIGNALKFCPRGSEITVAAAQQNGRVRFSIKDQGPGISRGDQEHLFDPFWQARSGKGGVGLGLPIAQAIVRAHSGRMWVESQPGQGSTFSFTLPLARSERPRQADQAAAD